MTYSEITNLLDKGFTPEMIMQISGGNPGTVQEEAPAEAPADSGKDVENNSPAPETTENTHTPPADNPQPVAAEVEKVIGELKVLREQMTKMRDEFQKGAILSDSIRTPAQVSADEALSELIRPKYDNK